MSGVSLIEQAEMVEGFVNSGVLSEIDAIGILREHSDLTSFGARHLLQNWRAYA
jgi:hypothetical protein